MSNWSELGYVRVYFNALIATLDCIAFCGKPLLMQSKALLLGQKKPAIKAGFFVLGNSH